jgi:hypothetical protein
MPNHKNRNAGLKSAATKGQEELDRAGREAAWTKKHCAPGTRDPRNNPDSRQNYYSPSHPLYPKRVF